MNRHARPFALALSGVAALAFAGSSCASLGPRILAPLKKGTIEVYQDADGVCQTNTTPYFKVKKSTDRKVEWKVVDEGNCLSTGDSYVELRFQTDPLVTCDKKNRRKIECDLPDDASTGQYKYSVWIKAGATDPRESEDPVLEIEM